LGPVSLTKLHRHFKSWIGAWIGKASDYLEAGLPGKSISQIIAEKQKIKPELSFAELTRRGIEIILATEKTYPSLLKEIITAPPLLYVRGQKEVLNSTTIAVVGTRKISPYGRQACEELSLGLVSHGVTIVSGLAFGIDAVAL